MELDLFNRCNCKLTSTRIHKRRKVGSCNRLCQYSILTFFNSHFFSVVGSTIKICSTTSGKVVSTLPRSHDEGHTDVITSAILSAQNSFQLITASLDGTIKVWDFLEGALLHTIDLDQPIHHICTHEKTKGHVFVAAAKKAQTMCEFFLHSAS